MLDYISASESNIFGNSPRISQKNRKFNPLLSHTSGMRSNLAMTNSALRHNGSNTMWLADIKIFPGKNTALFIVTNAADLQKEQNSNSFKAVAKSTQLLQSNYQGMKMNKVIISLTAATLKDVIWVVVNNGGLP